MTPSNDTGFFNGELYVKFGLRILQFARRAATDELKKCPVY